MKDIAPYTEHAWVHYLIASFIAVLVLFIVPPSVMANNLPAFTPPDSITVTMKQLVFPGGGDRGVPCSITPPDIHWGCTAFDVDHYSDDTRAYPYATNPVSVPIETDYLLDVIPQEMGTYYHPTAQQAQAVAARTYAYWHIAAGYILNNSNSYHVFIPLKFESLPPAIATITETTPCTVANLSTERAAASQGTTCLQIVFSRRCLPRTRSTAYAYRSTDLMDSTNIESVKPVDLFGGDFGESGF